MLAAMLGVLHRAHDTTLVIPVPAAETVVAAWRDTHDPSAKQGMPAHITTLYPFLPAKELTRERHRMLRDLFCNHRQFGFRLTGLGRFPGVLYLEPDPAEPFVALTEAVKARFPGLVPYGGKFEYAVPHLTVCDGREPPDIVHTLEAALPIECVATHVRLMELRGHRRWITRASFPFS